MSFTLGGKLIARVHAEIPLEGVASADVELDGATVLSGRQTLTLGDLAHAGTIVDGGVSEGRGRYHWMAGAAGWRLPIPARGYGSSQVRRASVITDAAAACGETVVLGIPDTILGLPSNGGYLRTAGPGWDVLKALSVPWYMDTAGVTQIRERPTAAASTDGTLEGAWPQDGRLVIVPAAEKIKGYLPGLTIGGAKIRMLHIDAAPGEPIRLTIWTQDERGESHEIREQLDRIHNQNASARRFHGRYRYRATTHNGTLYGIEPVDKSLGLDSINNRDLWFGIPGFEATLTRDEASIVVVSFLDGDPAHPVIDGYLRRGASAAIPAEVSLDATRVKFGGAAQKVARETDPIDAGTIEIQAAATVLAFSYTDQDGLQYLVWITGTAPPGGGPVTWAVVPQQVATTGPVKGRIGTPSQGKTYA